MPRLLSLGKKKVGAAGPATSPQDFLAYVSPESVQRIFEQLLAPRALQGGTGTEGGTGSFHCSLSVLKCIEKYYCWLGIHRGYLELTRRPPATSCSAARDYFAILRPLSEHQEWQVFLTIVMTVAEVSWFHLLHDMSCRVNCGCCALSYS
jgi:hypothetical protein